MKIVIAGAGSVGRSVALELLAHGHDITLIDKLPEKLRIATVADADWVLADACSPDALRDAGVEDAGRRGGRDGRRQGEPGHLPAGKN